MFLEKKSYAKLNLSLRVGPKQANGYHPIQSIFQQISLHDNIHIKVSHPPVNTPFNLISLGYDVPLDGTNILDRVFDYFKSQCKHSYDIFLDKNIPTGSGMGGASSNAATLIKVINEVEQLGLSEDELCVIGAKFGADIPFFIKGGTAKVEGIGEKLTKLKECSKQYYLIVYPDFHCSTKEIYEAYDSLPRMPLPLIFDTKEPYLGTNDLKEVVLNLYPTIRHIVDSINDITKNEFYMTGSGSTFFIPVESTSEGLVLVNAIQSVFPDFLTEVVESINAD